jgi:hypothetical protein
VTLLAVLFPALVAGAGIEQPAGHGELVRLRRGAAAEHDRTAGPALVFYGATLPSGAASFADPQLEDRLPIARLGSVLALFVISGLLWVSVTIARDRGRAVLACLALGVLPPVARAGCIVRPELPTAVFALLALAILLGLPAQLHASRRRRGLAKPLVLGALALAVATATALAVASSRAYGAALLVPAGCLLLVVALQLQRTLRLFRRFGPVLLPLRAFTARVLPWFAPAFLALVVTAAVLSAVGAPEATTWTEAGLVPRSPWLALPIVALALLGFGVSALRVGLRIGRRRTLMAESILLVHVVVMLAQRMRLGPADDALPAAPAMAFLLAEGARTLLGFGLGRLRARGASR